MSFYLMKKTKKGAALVEYGLLLSLISVVSIGAVFALGKEVDKTFSSVAVKMHDVDAVAGGEATDGRFTGAGGAGAPGGAGADGGEGGEEPGGPEEFCPPEGWTWNASNSTYTLSGLSSLTGQRAQGGTRSSLTPPGSNNIVIQVPNPSSLDLWVDYAYQHPTNNYHYWSWTMQLDAEQAQPPGSGC